MWIKFFAAVKKARLDAMKVNWDILPPDIRHYLRDCRNYIENGAYTKYSTVSIRGDAFCLLCGTAQTEHVRSIKRFFGDDLLPIGDALPDGSPNLAPDGLPERVFRTGLYRQFTGQVSLTDVSQKIAGWSPSVGGARPGFDAARGSFLLFQQFLFSGRPASFPCQSLRGIGQASLWRQPPPYIQADSVKINQYLNALAPNQLVVLDIECWPCDMLATDADFDEALPKYLEFIQIARNVRPDIRIAYYGNLPLRNYWGPVGGNAANLAKWKSRNAAWAEIANYVDAIFPSLYTFENNQANWIKYARANIDEARQYDKPVIPYLWMFYHDSVPTIGNTLIDGTFWRAQLDTCAQYADGAVMWGGWQQPWDNNAPWWQSTLSFISTMGI